MRLPDPQRSYVVLIGTSTYQSAELADLPAVRNNLDDLAAVLTNPALGGLPPGHCVVIPDPTDTRTLYRTLRHYATATEDTLLVYFAGHGRTGPRNELYLGLADTDPDELKVSALAFDLIRDVLADSTAVNRVVILDCCFSGRAIQDMSGDDETVLGQIGIEGSYVLASAPANAVALAPIGARHTAFTGELLNLLQAGVPGGPELLTFSTIYRRLLHTTTARGLPIPRQRGTGTVDLLALTRNPAATTQTATTPASSPYEQPAARAAREFTSPFAPLAMPGRYQPIAVSADAAHRAPEQNLSNRAVTGSRWWLMLAVALMTVGIGGLLIVFFANGYTAFADVIGGRQWRRNGVDIVILVVGFGSVIAGSVMIRRRWPLVIAVLAVLATLKTISPTLSLVALVTAVLISLGLALRGKTSGSPTHHLGGNGDRR